LERDSRSVREWKEKNDAECELLRVEAKALAEKLSGERIALCRAEGEKDDALRLLKEAVDERDSPD